MPTWATQAIADTWPGEFATGKALARLAPDLRSEIPSAAAAAQAALAPMPRDKLKQRLTALGMVMSPNRPAAEATMWVREMARLLGDLPGDVLAAAIDTAQMRMKFLPTVAEIREIAEPETRRREREALRLGAMQRFLESGQEIPALEAPKKPLLDRRGEPMSEAETEELNEILERIGACKRYRADGSSFFAKEPKPAEPKHRRNPTRADYIAMGVDPAVLDEIACEEPKAG